MTVEELFQKLSYGELSNLAIAVDGTGAIKKDQQNRIVHFANEALRELHSRFPLAQEEVILALTGSEQQEAFPSADVLKVVSMLTAWGESIAFGDQAVPGTVFVKDRVIYFPANTFGSELQVTYQKRHAVLDPVSTPADLTQEITLIDDLTEALTARIAYKVYRDMRTPESLVAANDHRARYEEVIREAQVNGALPGEILPGSKFEARGFV